MDALVVIGAALALGSPLALAPWATAAFVVLVAAGLLRARRFGLLALALALLLGANVRARSYLARYEQRRTELLEGFQSPRACHGEGRVSRSASGRNDGSFLLELDATLICDGLRDTRAAIALTVPATVAVAPLRGELVAFEAELAVVTRFVLSELPDPRPRAAARGVQLSGKAVFLERRQGSRTIGGLVDRLREHVRARVRRFFSARAAPMAEALLLGDRVLEADDDRAFAASGLSHLLAVSGMHLVLAIATLERTTRAILVRTPLAARYDMRRPAACVAALLAILYADFAGGSGSAWRAAATMTLTFVAAAGDRRLEPSRALGASVIAMALLDPFVIHDLSFVLSVLATAGLLAFGKRSSDLLGRMRVPKLLANLLGPTLAASITCMALLARIAPGVPTVALLLNLVAIPLSESFALPLCLGFAVLPDVDALQRGFALAGGNALELTLWVARFGAELPRVTLPAPTPLEIALLAAGFPSIAGALRSGGLRELLRALLLVTCGLLAAELAHRWECHPRGRLRVTQLDIGQGDSALIDLPDGSAMLVDGGGIVGGLDVGERVLGPLLRARRRDRLRLIVVTHPHPDHYGGLATGAAEIAIDEIWDTLEPTERSSGPASPVTSMQDAWRSWRAARAAAGTRLLAPAEFCGQHELGGTTLRVRMPCPELDPNVGANDNSIVFSLTFAGHAALFVGDAEHAEETRLLEHGELRADLLKIGHHGSRTSTSADFLRAVAPRIAMVSAGARNKFGHPHPDTLGTLAAAGIPLARTDRMGELRIEWNQQELWVDTAAFSVSTAVPPYWLPQAPPRSGSRR